MTLPLNDTNARAQPCTFCDCGTIQIALAYTQLAVSHNYEVRGKKKKSGQLVQAAGVSGNIWKVESDRPLLTLGKPSLGLETAQSVRDLG